MSLKKMKMKRKSNEPQQFEFCDVCRLNHNQGRRHNYFPTHKASLATLLTRFQSKLTHVKSFLKSPTPIRPDFANQNRLWCIFCNCNILELDNPFSCGNVIQHLASVEHWKRIKGFMWKYGGGMNSVDLFRISESDYAKWEKKCRTLETEAAKAESIGPVTGPPKNIHNELHADSVNSLQKDNIDSCNFFISNGVVPLHSYTNERTQTLCSVSSIPDAGPSSRNIPGSLQRVHAQDPKENMDNLHCSTYHARECSSYGYLRDRAVNAGVRTANGENTSPVPSCFLLPEACVLLQLINLVCLSSWVIVFFCSFMQDRINLTRISSSSKEALEENVHSGAPPPWFDATNGNQLNDVLKTEEKDLLSPKARKSSKLNPKRVGAAWAERRKLELELEKRGELVKYSYDANWLPNFGRVWQSGPRKESRKEFQMESKASPKTAEQTEIVMTLQPYIGKRKVKSHIFHVVSILTAHDECNMCLYS
ncbi:HORMA domain-containing protein 1 [Striga asiatica]|uniref:HORMA domain-containing protein 1 n=1 Tax=Striga asiatica TaxID=4170 RepID=A0A5A7PHW1_STRAF|nr:HORMA domain-containing protein 1 [Striga asiatica]